MQITKWAGENAFWLSCTLSWLLICREYKLVFLWFGVWNTFFRAPDSCGHKISELGPCCSPDSWNWQDAFSRELCCSRVGTMGTVTISVSPFWHVLCFGEDLRPALLQWSCPVNQIHGCPSCHRPSPKPLVQGGWIVHFRHYWIVGCLTAHAPALTQWPLPPSPSKMFGCSSLSLVCMVKGLSLKHFSQLETFTGLSFVLQKKSWQPWTCCYALHRQWPWISAYSKGYLAFSLLFSKTHNSVDSCGVPWIFVGLWMRIWEGVWL